MANGAGGAIANVTYARWYGRTHNGKIQGIASALGVLGSATGPALLFQCPRDGLFERRFFQIRSKGCWRGAWGEGPSVW